MWRTVSCRAERSSGDQRGCGARSVETVSKLREDVERACQEAYSAGRGRALCGAIARKFPEGWGFGASSGVGGFAGACFSRTAARVGVKPGDPRCWSPFPKWPRESGSNPATRAVGRPTRNGRASRDQTRRPALPVALPETAARAGIKPGDPRCRSPFSKWPRESGAWPSGTSPHGAVSRNPRVWASRRVGDARQIAPGGRGQVGPRQPPATEHTATGPTLPRPSGVIPVGAPIRREAQTAPQQRSRPTNRARTGPEDQGRTSQQDRPAPFPERGPLRRSRRRPGPFAQG